MPFYRFCDKKTASIVNNMDAEVVFKSLACARIVLDIHKRTLPAIAGRLFHRANAILKAFNVKDKTAELEELLDKIEEKLLRKFFIQLSGQSIREIEAWSYEALKLVEEIKGGIEGLEESLNGFISAVTPLSNNCRMRFDIDRYDLQPECFIMYSHLTDEQTAKIHRSNSMPNLKERKRLPKCY